MAQVSDSVPVLRSEGRAQEEQPSARGEQGAAKDHSRLSWLARTKTARTAPFVAMSTVESVDSKHEASPNPESMASASRADLVALGRADGFVSPFSMADALAKYSSEEGTERGDGARMMHLDGQKHTVSTDKISEPVCKSAAFEGAIDRSTISTEETLRQSLPAKIDLATDPGSVLHAAADAHSGRSASNAAFVSVSAPASIPGSARASIQASSHSVSIPTPANAIADTEEDQFLFRAMGRKLREQLRKLGSTFSVQREGAEEEPEMAHIPYGQYQDMTMALWSAFRVPVYALHRDDLGRRSIPLMLALIKVHIKEPLETPSSVLPNAMLQVELSYANGQLKWTIHRRLYDFFRLHTILTLRHLQGHLAAKLPHFPSQVSYLFDTTALTPSTRQARREHRLQSARERWYGLQLYLQRLLFALTMEPNAPELFEFLECSLFSLLTREDCHKRKEGYLKNRVFESRPKGDWRACLLPCFPRGKKFRTQWFVVRSTYIAVCDGIEQAMPSEVLLCDKHFHLIVEHEHSKNLLKPTTITLHNGSCRLQVRPESSAQTAFWLEEIRRLALECIWCQPHRFGSFAPVRRNSRVQWLVDGEAFYEELVRAIRAARHEIFLHGWWISPELHLLRPPALHPHMRLDRLLQRKAREGVQIYIMVFKEFSMALSLNSHHTKCTLERLHPNIRVQRHPDHLRGVLYWAHHEKLAVIDQQVAFTGGLDLCFGRYDTPRHPLSDYHPHDQTGAIWTGLDYANPRIKDFRNVTQHASTLIDRRLVPRMPWHDVHALVVGTAARDMARHFIERWNFVKQQKAMHKQFHIPFLLPKPELTQHELQELDHAGTQVVQLVRSVADWSMGTPAETSIYDAYMYYIENAQHFIYIENQFFISRSSPHQLTPIKNRIASAVVERILRAHAEERPFRVLVFLPLLPAFEAAVHTSEASSLRMLMQGQYSAISRGPHSILGQLAARGIAAEEYISFFALRTHGLLEGRAVTEQLYIHSKVMIVDDQVAIIGSSNINDRSMLGVRDSELSMIVEDTEQVPARLHGTSVTVARKVRELRMRLMQEHLGLLHLPAADPSVQALEDPLVPEFYHGVLRHQAALNTQIYRELFHCLPDDCVDTWEEYRRFIETPRTHIVDEELGINSLEMLQAARGNIVLFPTQFLKREDLAASLLTPEFLLPVEVYL